MKTVNITPFIQYLKLNYIIKNVYNGLHSQFPYCCIIWHTFVHAPHYIWLTKYLPYVFDLNHRERDHTGYVRCPICLKLNYKVDFHVCGPECPTMAPIEKIEGIERIRQAIFQKSKRYYKRKEIR